MDYQHIFKIAQAMIEEQLSAPQPAAPDQTQEPADLDQPTFGQSVLNFLGRTTATTTEPAPKVLHVDSGKRHVDNDT
jgi:hypothetical protein